MENDKSDKHFHTGGKNVQVMQEKASKILLPKCCNTDWALHYEKSQAISKRSAGGTGSHPFGAYAETKFGV